MIGAVGEEGLAAFSLPLVIGRMENGALNYYMQGIALI
jgi:hypothetical protein